MLRILTNHCITPRFYNNHSPDYQFIKQKIPLEKLEVFFYLFTLQNCQ